MRLTEANDLVAILNEVLDCYLVSATAIDGAIVRGVHRTDTASIEATGVGKANLLRQWVSSVGNAAIGVESGMNWRSERGQWGIPVVPGAIELRYLSLGHCE